MKAKLGLFMLAGLMAACSSTKKEKPLLIKGLWLAVRPNASYISLDFADTTAVFDNLADTINRFTYTIDQVKRELVLTDPFGKKETAAILKLDKDSVVFNRLWDLNTVQRFYKSKK